MKTFKLVLLILVLLTTTWLMVEGAKVNLVAEPTVVSSSETGNPHPGPAVLLR